MTESNELTRLIIGIENRSAQEVFDIMCDRIRQALALRTPPDGEVVVKPLEWEVGTSGMADTPFGEYTVQHYTESDGEGWETVFQDAVVVGQFSSSDEAIAAAQADYEQRILSALTGKE